MHIRTYLYLSKEGVGWIETVQFLSVLMLVETTSLSEMVPEKHNRLILGQSEKDRLYTIIL